MNKTEEKPVGSGLKFSDVTRFLSERATSNDCPSCGQNDWTAQYGRLRDDEDAVFSSHVLVMGTPFEANENWRIINRAMPVGRPILPLVCNNCAYMRMYDLAPIVAWVKDQEKDGSSDTVADNEEV